MPLTFYLLVIFAYLVGAIPFGLLLGRLFADVDVRGFGSGNIGATNVNRVLGRKLGAATLLCDVLKGLIVVLLAKFLLPQSNLGPVMVGMAAFLGHCYPIYLGFHGGKGVATAFGVLIPVSFFSALVGLFVWIVVARTSRISSLGALVAAVVVPFAVLFIEESWTQTFLIAFMMGIVVWRHRENIERLRSGNELKP